MLSYDHRCLWQDTVIMLDNDKLSVTVEKKSLAQLSGSVNCFTKESDQHTNTSQVHLLISKKKGLQFIFWLTVGVSWRQNRSADLNSLLK